MEVVLDGVDDFLRKGGERFMGPKSRSGIPDGDVEAGLERKERV